MKKPPGRIYAGMFLMMLVSVLFPDTALPVNIGDPFPVFTRPNTLSPAECSYLKISCTDEFSIDDLTQDVIVVEFLNVYCHTCRMQVQIFNDIYRSIEKDPDMAGKVCIVGIAVGNTAEEVLDFKKNFGALYPILTDQNKEIFSMTGNVQGTPHTYILRKEDRNFIIDYHAGGVTSQDRYLETITLAMRGSFTGVETGNKAKAYSFSSQETAYTQKDFAGKRVLLYFPVEKRYPLQMDTRNTENQLAVLQQILERFPSLSVLMADCPGCVPDGVPLHGRVFALHAERATREAFGRTDIPTIYFINQYGRISFKGEAITLYNAESIIEGKEYRPVSDMPEKEVIALINRHIAAMGKEIFSTESFIMENREKIFVTTLSPKRDGQFIFSRLEIAPSLCDVCHDSHFIYILDQEGVLLDFIPVQLTKYGNVHWNEDDAAKMKKQLVGRSVFERFSFNPKVDAVTSATMTSSLIYETMNRGTEFWGSFKEYRFRGDHWEQVCRENMCAAARHMAAAAVKAGVPAGETLLQEVVKQHNIACPLKGMYIFLDGTVLCTIHGICPADCKKSDE